MRGLLLVAASVALVSTPVAAQPPTSYLCEVRNVYQLSLSGDVEQSFGGSGRRGDRFKIDANTGEMTGASALTSGGWAKTAVIDSGTSLTGSFKVMASSPSPDGESTNVGYLEIQGTMEQPRRPFLYQLGGSLYSGTCHAPEEMRTDD
jgi:hypothetical protein